jgi:hypothetical protein
LSGAFEDAWGVNMNLVGLDERILDPNNSEFDSVPFHFHFVYICQLLVSVKEGKLKTPQ